MAEQRLPAEGGPPVVGRTGSAVRSGAVAAARRVLASEPSGDPRATALAQVALGRLLREDGLRGLSHPTDPRLVRPGIAGSVVGVVVAGLFTAVPLVGLTALGAGPLAEDEEVVDTTTLTPLPGPPDEFPGDSGLPPLDGSLTDTGPPEVFVWVVGAFAVLGLLLLAAALVGLAGRLRALVVGARLERRGRAALASLPGGATPATAAAEEEALERLCPRFAGMLSWTLPRRSGGTLHDRHDPF